MSGQRFRDGVRSAFVRLAWRDRLSVFDGWSEPGRAVMTVDRGEFSVHIYLDAWQTHLLAWTLASPPAHTGELLETEITEDPEVMLWVVRRYGSDDVQLIVGMDQGDMHWLSVTISPERAVEVAADLRGLLADGSGS